jgi:hypothetical protein
MENRRLFCILKLCACDCGEFIRENAKRPWPGQRYNQHHQPHAKGKDHQSWKGGIIIKPSGYVMVWRPGHPRADKHHGYVYQHILVMEEILGRPLDKDEQVHHLDGNRSNNSRENLIVMTKFEHNSHHGKKRWEAGKMHPRMFQHVRDKVTGRYIS